MQVKTGAICSENDQLKQRLAALEKEKIELQEKLKVAEGISLFDFPPLPPLSICFLFDFLVYRGSGDCAGRLGPLGHREGAA